MLSNRLRELRINHQISQAELANLLGINQQAVGKWERGKASPDYESLIRIAILYDVTTDYLLGRTDDPTPPQTQKEKTPSEQEEVLRDLDGITPEMALEVRQYIGYLKHKNEAANALGKKT